MNIRPLLALPALLLLVVAWHQAADSGVAAPETDQYTSVPLVADAYLGANGASLIEFAMIPGQPNEAIVVRQSGHIYRVALDGSFAPNLWGNLSSKVNFNNEEGLLAVAFSPDFTTSGRVYAYYTPGSPSETKLARYSATATDLNEASEEIILSIEEFASNHNGGHIAFDSDGLLYLSLGDGGGFGDPRERGQSLETLLGKVLRINVSGTSGYTIPAGNPFSDGAGPIREEIFAYGFRNPFRMTIDPVTDDVWLGDVGQGSWEEVDKVVAGGNYGWDCREGNHDYNDNNQGYPLLPCTGPFLPARAEYSHSFGQAVTGGVVYRGDDMPELYGWYVYGDFYSGHIWAVDIVGNGAPVHLMQAPYAIPSFTLLPDGEIAVVSYSDGVYRLVKDSDSDTVADVNDNCPNWPNTGQGLPPWSVPAGDSDCDGFPSTTASGGRASEAALGTNATDACPATAAFNDEAIDAWPPDFNDSRRVDLSDLGLLGTSYNSMGPNPPYAARFDLNADNRVNLADLGILGVFFNKSCT